MLAKLENVQREREKERMRWEQQMTVMQGEVGQLNQIISEMVAERSQSAMKPIRCKCRHRIKDLER